MTRRVFADSETTGLDEARHEMWELALIVRQGDGDEAEHLFQWWPNLTTADPGGLRVSRFYDRIMVPPPWTPDHDPATAWHWSTDAPGDMDDALRQGIPQMRMPLAQVAHWVAHWLDGAHVFGAVPDFDVRMLKPFLRRWGHAYTAHYHPHDVEDLAVGWMAGREMQPPDLPWNTDAMLEALGVLANPEARHTALGDVRVVRAIHDVVFGGRDG